MHINIFSFFIIYIYDILKVYGDVHGNFAALIRFFYEFGSPLTRPELGFLFLGMLLYNNNRYLIIIVN